MRVPTLTSLSLLATLAAAIPARGQSPTQPAWPDIERRTLEHFQAILRLGTRNPPSNETRAAQYIRKRLRPRGIPAELVALDSTRANVVDRLKGSVRPSSWGTPTS